MMADSTLLATLGAIELLETDDRPVFVLDLTSASKTIPIYQNAGFCEISGMESKTRDGKTMSDPNYIELMDWAASRHVEGNQPNQPTYCDLDWTTRMFRNRWQIVFGNKKARQAQFNTSHSQFDIASIGQLQIATTDHREHSRYAQKSDPKRDEVEESEDGGHLDFTRPNPAVVITPHLKFILEFDWASTELGAMSTWSPELRRMANIVMADPRPAVLYWGKNCIHLYNEPYVVIMKQRHPGMMGKSFAEAWPEEAAAEFVSALEASSKIGKAIVISDGRYYIDWHGYLEETYFSVSMIPFSFAHDGVGFYTAVFDTTRQVISDRRMAFLVRLGQFISSSRKPKDFWQRLLHVLGEENPDLPFGILYSADDVNETLSETSTETQSLKTWTLEGVAHLSKSCPSIPSQITTERAMEDFLPGFNSFLKSKTATLLTTEDGTLPHWISKKIRVNNSENDCEFAVFLPIQSTPENVLGFALLGLNHWKRFDDDYKMFLELISGQLAASMAAAVLFEDEIRCSLKAAEQAAQDKSLLSTKLAIQTHEARETETRFRRMADLAPAALCHFNQDGVLVYGNNEFYRMTGHSRDDYTPLSWYEVVAETDHCLLDNEWAKLHAGEPVSFELRLRTPFVAEDIIAGEKVEGYTWIIAAAHPEKDEDGTVTGCSVCLTDISRQKWMEGFQTRKMLEAVKLKRQQESFIDMTSHEMRNPLSAILQCADYIAASLSEFGGDSKNVTLPREVAEGYVDAAQTVVLCGQHQKRIIDDVLTLSKLESDLLLITPIEVQPISVVQTTLKMFDNEIQKSDMELRFNVERSYKTLAVDWVMLDPSRVLQILINLTTNAIKFTQTEQSRKITVNLAASKEPPLDRSGMEYLPRSTNRKDLSLGSAWGTGETVYLYFEVKDSGRGLNDEERKALFKRFSQASPKTHVQYGGSGLGLFISRELTELQGGQIGVSSKAGVGSTFAFFVRARRCNVPEDQTPIDRKAQPKPRSRSFLSRIPTRSGPSTVSNRMQQVSPVLRHVLIVEDNLVNQKVLSQQLRGIGCIVHVANHGKEALTFLSNSSYWSGLQTTKIELSVVLMDVEMPIMDGLTCVREIRRLQTEGSIIGHVPIIALTANARSEQISIAKDAGMDSVVTKPFRIPELLPEMERQIRKAEEREHKKSLKDPLRCTLPCL